MICTHVLNKPGVSVRSLLDDAHRQGCAARLEPLNGAGRLGLAGDVMKRFHSFSALSAATVFGAVAMVAQTLLLRRFLWRFESAETGVALFVSCWLFWSGMGAAAACTPLGRRAAGFLSRAVWLLIAACGLLYFAQYALIENIRSWLGVPEYQTFPRLHLAVGCLAANAPFGLVAGLVIPSVCRCLHGLGGEVSRAFAWEALGAALGGLGVTLLLVHGVAPDPRDESEWFRYFPQAIERPGRFETGCGTTFFGSHGGSFYALSSVGVEVVPEGDRAMELAVLLLSQRPYAKEVLLLGKVPLAAGLALEALRPDLTIVWCPCDAQYGLSVLAVAGEGGLETRVKAAGETPQRYLGRQSDATFECVLVAPPPATTLEGAAWRQEAFARQVRRVTKRTGVALFGLDCEAATLTPEMCVLLDGFVSAIRQVWPECGVFAAGAGGWWVAAQVPRLCYEAEAAAARFAMLKRELYPAAAVPLLYDQQRAQRLAQQCPALNVDRAVLLPESARVEEVLSWGLADAVRRGYPDVTPGVWLAWLKTSDSVRVLGLVLVVLWMAPVALGGRTQASRRLLAAWLATCGALGLAVSLAVLYRLQMRFGSLYLLAGAGSCLYLAGLFCGNRLGECLVWGARGRPLILRGLVVVLTVAQAGMALGIVFCAGTALTAYGTVILCFAAGCAAGVTVPLALAVSEGDMADAAVVFVLADAVGAAVGGLFFALLVPLAGLPEAVACFAALACGTAVCVALGGRSARLAAGLALITALAVLGGRLRDAWPQESPEGSTAVNAGSEVTQGPKETPASDIRKVPELCGISRKVEVEVIRKQMREGTLATNAAAFWKPD